MTSFARRRRAVVAGLVHGLWRWVKRAGAVTADTAVGRRFAAFGPGSLIAFPYGTVYGERWITIGDSTMLGEQVSICAGMAPGHDLGADPVLRIGDRCVIGRGSHIVAHHSIDIGDDVYTGPYVYITDQNHGYADPDQPIGRQWPVNAPVRIGSGTWLGTGVAVLPGAVIGRNVVVAAGAMVRGQFGDRCVLAGVPARVVKKIGPDDDSAATPPDPNRSGVPAPEPDQADVSSPGPSLWLDRSGVAPPEPGWAGRRLADPAPLAVAEDDRGPLGPAGASEPVA